MGHQFHYKFVTSWLQRNVALDRRAVHQNPPKCKPSGNVEFMLGVPPFQNAINLGIPESLDVQLPAQDVFILQGAPIVHY